MTDSPLTEAERGDGHRRVQLRHLQRQAEAMERLADSTAAQTRHLERQAAALEKVRTYAALSFWLLLVAVLLVVLVTVFMVDFGVGY
jgi:hypothetical protein